MNQPAIRALVQGAYDLQKLRIQTGLRLVANFKVKIGQEPGTSEEDLDEKTKQILTDIRRDYNLITEALAGKKRQPRVFVGQGLISEYSEYSMMRTYCMLEDSEEQAFKDIKRAIADHPLAEFFDSVKGLGPAMGGVIISEINIHAAQYPSSLWKYAGLDVAQDGAGRSMRKDHLIDRAYTTKDGEASTRKSITYNPFLKTKLMGVLAGCLIKAGGPYSDVYRNYKHRLEHHESHAKKTPMHRHNMAMRYMIKMFLADLYNVWRAIEGLPVAPSYHEAKLGHTHGQQYAA